MGPQGRKQTRTVDDNAGIGLFDDLQRDLVAVFAFLGLGVIEGRVDQGMGQNFIVGAHVVVIATHVVAELGTSFGKKVSSGGERHHRSIFVIWCAAEHAV